MAYLRKLALCSSLASLYFGRNVSLDWNSSWWLGSFHMLATLRVICAKLLYATWYISSSVRSWSETCLKKEKKASSYTPSWGPAMDTRVSILWSLMYSVRQRQVRPP